MILNSLKHGAFLSPYKIDGSPKTILELHNEKTDSNNKILKMKDVYKKERLLKRNNKLYEEALEELERINIENNTTDTTEDNTEEENSPTEDSDNESSPNNIKNKTILRKPENNKTSNSNKEKTPESKLIEEDMETLNGEDISNITIVPQQENKDQNYSGYIQHQHKILHYIYSNKNINVKDKEKYHSEITSMLEIYIEQIQKIAVLEEQLKENQIMNKNLLKEIKDIKFTQEGINKNKEPKKTRNKNQHNIKQSHCIIIKPKNKKTSEETFKDLKKTIDPHKIKIRIERIKTITDGGLIINTPTAEEAKILDTEITKRKILKNNYNITTPKKRKPQLILFNVSNELSEEEIISGIVNNHKDIQQKDLIVKHKYNTKNNYTSNWIIEIEPYILNKLEPNKISIGWEIINYKENIRPTRCYNCGRYGHKSNKCKNNTCCLRCGSSDHKQNNCNSIEPNCINCKFFNQRYNSTYETNHICLDIKCPIWEREKLKIINRTDYSE